MIKDELINLIKLLQVNKSDYTFKDIEEGKKSVKPGNTASNKLGK